MVGILDDEAVLAIRREVQVERGLKRLPAETHADVVARVDAAETMAARRHVQAVLGLKRLPAPTHSAVQEFLRRWRAGHVGADELAAGHPSGDTASAEAWEDARTAEELIDLIKASGYEMSPEEQEAQRRSFAYGNVAIDNPNVTKKMVEEAAGIEGGAPESERPVEIASHCRKFSDREFDAALRSVGRPRRRITKKQPFGRIIRTIPLGNGKQRVLHATRGWREERV